MTALPGSSARQGTTRRPQDTTMPDAYSLVTISKCTTAHGFVFVSGQLAFLPSGALLEGCIADQTRQVFMNIEQVLDQNNSGLSEIVKTTVWLTDPADLAEFNTVYAACFSGSPFPARSTVVSSLVVPGAKVEIEVIAKVRARPAITRN